MSDGESGGIGFEEEGAAYAAAPTAGAGVIRGYLPSLPDRPGVYRMLDARSAVLYVGKARSLRKRVANYANATGHSTRISRMIAATASMMFVTTETETEALLLEANLIKQLKPHFNVLLRDDKSFPHILIGGEHPFAQLRKHRGLKATRGRYFGPFASAGAVSRTINTLQKAFLLRTCRDSMRSSSCPNSRRRTVCVPLSTAARAPAVRIESLSVRCPSSECTAFASR